MLDKLDNNVMFAIALEIVTILQSKPIDKEDEQLVLQIVNKMLLFRDDYKSISLLSASNK